MLTPVQQAMNNEKKVIRERLKVLAKEVLHFNRLLSGDEPAHKIARYYSNAADALENLYTAGYERQTGLHPILELWEQVLVMNLETTHLMLDSSTCPAIIYVCEDFSWLLS